MPATERPALIERYKQGHAVVVAALGGATDAQLDARGEPGQWTAREIAHHLADSEMTSGVRLRRLLAEHDPLIDGYDEMEFASRLHYERPIAASLELLRAARTASAELLSLLTASDWERSGRHSESGAYSVGTWLEIYTAHAHDHAEQISRALGGGGGAEG